MSIRAEVAIEAAANILSGQSKDQPTSEPIAFVGFKTMQNETDLGQTKIRELAERPDFPPMIRIGTRRLAVRAEWEEFKAKLISEQREGRSNV